MRSIGERMLALTLLVLRILPTHDAADELPLAIATNHETAVFADRLGGRANFHEGGRVME